MTVKLLTEHFGVSKLKLRLLMLVKMLVKISQYLTSHAAAQTKCKNKKKKPLLYDFLLTVKAAPDECVIRTVQT